MADELVATHEDAACGVLGGAEIHYTTDGSTPTAESTLYSEAFTLTENTTVKAIAIKDGESSEVATKYFYKSGNPGGGMDQN